LQHLNPLFCTPRLLMNKTAAGVGARMLHLESARASARVGAGARRARKQKRAPLLHLRLQMLLVGKRIGFLNLLYFCLFSVTFSPFSEPVSPSRDVMREVPLALLTSHLIVCDCGNPASLIEPVLRAKWSGIVSLEVDDLRVLKITFQSQSSKMAAKEGISKALVLVTPISQQAMHGDLLSFDFEKFIAASLDRRNIRCALLSMSPVPAIGGVGGGFFLKFAHEEFVPIAVRVLSEDAEFLKFFRIVQLSSW
jgi:hypothetical protein